MTTDVRMEITREQIDAVIAAIYVRLSGVDPKALTADLDAVLNPAGVAATMEVQGGWKVT